MKTKRMQTGISIFSMMSLALLLTGCGTPAANQVPADNSKPAVTTPSSKQPTDNSKPSAPVKPDVMVANNQALGQILVDGQGMTLYIYTKDTKDTSACYNTCASNWPPLLAEDLPKVAGNLVASKFGVTTRDDGNQQVTFEGMPLYHWAKDAKPGDATGQEVGGVWFVHKVVPGDLVSDSSIPNTK